MAFTAFQNADAVGGFDGYTEPVQYRSKRVHVVNSLCAGMEASGVGIAQSFGLLFPVPIAAA